MTMILAYILFGIAIGCVIGWFLAQGKLSSARTEAQLLKGQLEAAGAENVKSRDSITKLSAELSARKAELEGLSSKLSEQRQETLKIQEKFSAEFKNLANEILEDKSRRFTDMNKEHIGAVLNPLREKIAEFEKKVNEVHVTGIKDRGELLGEIRQLKELNQQITKEAAQLTSALQGEAKTQGDWGEFILEEILEKAGLERGIHYEVQKSVEKPLDAQDTGRTSYRPDVVVNLPDNKHIVIDSKVSLTAYVEYSKTDDHKKQEELLKKHLKSVEDHINELGDKKYHMSGDLKSPDFVLMFIPIEPAFILAARSDLKLWDKAFEKNIVIVTSSTLLATMRTVAGIWRQENQNKNAMEIAKKAGELYDKIADFASNMSDIGSAIKGIEKAYDSAMVKLEGRGNMLSKAEAVKKLGARTSKQLPQEVLEKIEGGTDAS